MMMCGKILSDFVPSLLFDTIHITKHVTFEEEEEVTKKKKKEKRHALQFEEDEE